MAGLRFKENARMFWWLFPLVLALLIPLGLGGCASGSLGGAFSGGASKNKAPLTPISFAPIIGAPPNVSSQLSGELLAQAKQQNIQVITEKGKPADYTIRGYLAASQDKNNNKVAYIWDVTDKTGKRVHRILGEEVTPTRAGRDPWSTFDQAALQKIATKTTTNLAAWLPKQSGSAAPQPAVAKQRQSVSQPAPRKRTKTARSTPSGPITAYVPAVSGAPGDGRKSLTNALKKQLTSKGIRLANSAGSRTYTVRGKVSLSRASGGQQDIKIDWQVLDPSGQRLGSISQANKVPKGSLDRQWGPIADAAAGAAADGIVKLIPKR